MSTIRNILVTIFSFASIFLYAQDKETNLKYIETLKKDIPTDTTRFPNGNIEKIRLWIKNTLFVTEYYSNGQRKKLEVSTPDSGREGMFTFVRLTEWCDNGQLIGDFPINSDKPGNPVKTYHCNGKVKEEFILNSANMTPAGNYKEYYETGILKMFGHYEDPTTDEYAHIPKKISEWKYYDETGKLFKVEHYQLDSLIKTTNY